MKSTKKVILSACLAALFACVALVSGVMLGLSLNKSTRFVFACNDFARHDYDACKIKTDVRLNRDNARWLNCD